MMYVMYTSFFIVYKNLLAKLFYICICIICILRAGWENSRHNNPKICSFLPPSPPKLYSLHTKFQFNPIRNKNIIFSCSHCSCTIFVLISYSFEIQVTLISILFKVQYSQNAVFSFEKFSNRQNHFSSGSHHLVKKSPGSVPYVLAISQGNA